MTFQVLTRRHIAFHEAGHAIIAHVLGGHVVELSCEQGRPHVDWYGDSVDDPMSISSRRVPALVKAASLPAQALAGPPTDDGMSAFEDLMVVEDLFPDEDERSAILAEAAALVARHQKAVAAVAEELLVRKRLTRVDLMTILEELSTAAPLAGRFRPPLTIADEMLS